MSLPSRTSSLGVAFIASFEGLRLKAYKLPGEAHYTIGYGDYGAHVRGGQVITKAEAERRLRGRLREFEDAVVRFVPRRWRRQQWQFDALVSIAFNLGAGVLTAEPPLTSLGEALRRRLPTRRNKDRIAAAMRLYDVDGTGRESEGLVRRRRCEARMYRTANYSTD